MNFKVTDYALLIRSSPHKFIVLTTNPINKSRAAFYGPELTIWVYSDKITYQKKWLALTHLTTIRVQPPHKQLQEFKCQRMKSLDVSQHSLKKSNCFSSILKVLRNWIKSNFLIFITSNDCLISYAFEIEGGSMT